MRLPVQGRTVIIREYKEDMTVEKWEIPAVLEMNVEETAGGKYEDVREDFCAHASNPS